MPSTSVHVSKHPLVAHKLAKLRHRDTDPKRFRELIREIAALLSYEATQDLALAPTTVPTPLSDAPGASLLLAVMVLDGNLGRWESALPAQAATCSEDRPWTTRPAPEAAAPG